jgi:Family of unknown function (DUF5372)
LAHTLFTALQHKEHLGSVTITHPFHPFTGRTFTVLKTRTVAGTMTLVLQEKERGSFAVPADWTDYLSANQQGTPSSDSFISPESLLALCELVKKYNK